MQEAVYEDLKKLYGSQGFVEYDPELIPEIQNNPDNATEGIVDLNINITEGKQFRLDRIEFTGNTFTRDNVFRREVLVNEGDIYDQVRLETSLIRLNQTQYFDPIDKDQDLELRTDADEGKVSAIVKVRERGRQQISFNGGTSGISGTFFGLEYSTNNLAGRGEILSFQFGIGNRQQSLQFSYQEPYFKDRPISVGFSVFASRYRFFGEGTFLVAKSRCDFSCDQPANCCRYTRSVYANNIRVKRFCNRVAFGNILQEAPVYAVFPNRFDVSILGDFN